MKKIISFILATILFILGITCVVLTSGCQRESDKVSYNIPRDADNFNVRRKLIVMNAITESIMFECEGVFSFELDSVAGVPRMVLLIKDGPNSYKKHSVGLNTMALWSVEDLDGNNVSNFSYEFKINPQMIVPFTTEDFFVLD